MGRDDGEDSSVDGRCKADIGWNDGFGCSTIAIYSTSFLVVTTKITTTAAVIRFDTVAACPKSIQQPQPSTASSSPQLQPIEDATVIPASPSNRGG